jgi:hypothetical protein
MLKAFPASKTAHRVRIGSRTRRHLRSKNKSLQRVVTIGADPTTSATKSMCWHAQSHGYRVAMASHDFMIVTR